MKISKATDLQLFCFGIDILMHISGLTIDKTRKWSIDDYEQLDESLRCEIIDAELFMTPAPGTKGLLINKLFKI